MKEGGEGEHLNLHPMKIAGGTGRAVEAMVRIVNGEVVEDDAPTAPASAPAAPAFSYSGAGGCRTCLRTTRRRLVDIVACCQNIGFFPAP